MPARILVLIVFSLLPQYLTAQGEDVASLRARVTRLEAEVANERRAARRNGVIALALGLGLTGYGLYRGRRDASRLAERYGVTDALTGLKNRRYVTQTIETDCNVTMRQHRMAAAAGLKPPINGDLLFLMVDIDRFKNINERYGHAAGDRLLSQIADTLRATCRTADTVARWSGEEFLLILRFTNRDTAAMSAERIRMAIEQRLIDLGNGRTFGCTCSIGFAAFPLEPSRPDEASWEQVIALADEAMQRAKQAGGNTWVGADTAALATVR